MLIDFFRGRLGKTNTSSPEHIGIIFADCHGSLRLRRYVIQRVKKIHRKHKNTPITCFLNGDGAGSRGPLMNAMVGFFYEYVKKSPRRKKEVKKVSGNLLRLVAHLKQNLTAEEKRALKNVVEKHFGLGVTRCHKKRAFHDMLRLVEKIVGRTLTESEEKSIRDFSFEKIRWLKGELKRIRLKKQALRRLLMMIGKIVGRTLTESEEKSIQEACVIAQHSGTFLAWLRQRFDAVDEAFKEEESGLIEYLRGFSEAFQKMGKVEFFLLPGNCEVSIVKDFRVDSKNDLKRERICEFRDRYYWKEQRRLAEIGVKFITKPMMVGRVLLVPSNTLETKEDAVLLQGLSKKASMVICHYPYGSVEEIETLDIGLEVRINGKDAGLINNFKALLGEAQEGAVLAFAHLHDPVTRKTGARGWRIFERGVYSLLYTSPGEVYEFAL